MSTKNVQMNSDEEVKKQEKNEVTYKCRNIATIEEVVYSDGITLYNLITDDGNSSEGLFNQTEIIIHLLVAMGKMSRPKTYIFKHEPK